MGRAVPIGLFTPVRLMNFSIIPSAIFEYRSVRFEMETLDEPDFQGTSVVNYTDRETPFTRILEFKHFEDLGSDCTIIAREYSSEWKPGDEPY